MLFVMFCRNFLMRNFSGVDFSATNTADKIRISHSKFLVHVNSIELQNVFVMHKFCVPLPFLNKKLNLGLTRPWSLDSRFFPTRSTSTTWLWLAAYCYFAPAQAQPQLQLLSKLCRCAQLGNPLWFLESEYSSVNLASDFSVHERRVWCFPTRISNNIVALHDKVRILSFSSALQKMRTRSP